MEPQNRRVSCKSFRLTLSNRNLCCRFFNNEPCSTSCNIWSVHNEEIEPGNNASSATWAGCNLPLRMESAINDTLDRKRSDNANAWLLESRSNGIIWSPYFWSIWRLLSLCHCAAEENVEVGIFSSCKCNGAGAEGRGEGADVNRSEVQRCRGAECR